MGLRSRKQVVREIYKNPAPAHEMSGEVKLIWALVRALAVVVIPIVTVAGVVYLFVWAGMPILTMCIGTAPVWACCILVVLCAYIYPMLRGTK